MIKNLDALHYDFKTFKQDYLGERHGILDREANDSRIMAIWNFYHNVSKGDVLLFVTSNVIFCYYVITGDHVECFDMDNSCIHFWQAEEHEIGMPVVVPDSFGHPFFQTLDKVSKRGIPRRRQVLAAIKASLG